jgi:hypothetical protein
VWVDYEAEDDSSVTAISMVERKETPGLLCASLNKWYKKTFFDAKGELVADRVMSYEDEDQNARISCQGSDVRMVIGPNADVVEQAIN